MDSATTPLLVKDVSDLAKLTSEIARKAQALPDAAAEYLDLARKASAEIKREQVIREKTIKAEKLIAEYKLLKETEFGSLRHKAARIAAAEATRLLKAQDELQVKQMALAEQQKANEAKGLRRLEQLKHKLADVEKMGSEIGSKVFGGINRAVSKIPGGDMLFKFFGGESKLSQISTKFGKSVNAGYSMVLKGDVAKGFNHIGAAGSRAISQITSALAKNPIAVAILAAIAVIAVAIKRFVELDKAAEEFRKTTGLIVPQMGHIAKIAREINVQMRHMGVGIEEAYKAAAALVETFQTAYAVTADVTTSIARLAANIGVAEGDSAKLYQTFLGMGDTTSEMAQNLMNAGVALANASGVPIAAVFKDIANASNDAMIFMGKSPILMLRTAVEARRLGTTMESLTKSARGLLNFQESINSEMEASAITGRTLNFQAARQLAFQGDLVKSRNEAMRQIKSLGDFQKMSVYQQEAVAKAAGMEVSEIVKMQAQEKQLAALKTKNYALWKKQDDMRRAAERATTQDLAEQGEALAKQQLRQAEITKMTNQLKAIWTDISDALLPIAQVIMPIVSVAIKLISINLKIVSGIIRGILSPLDKALESFGGMSGTMEKMMSMFDDFSDWAGKLGEMMGSLVGPTVLWSKSLQKAYDVLKWMMELMSKGGKATSWVGTLSTKVLNGMASVEKGVATVGGIFSKVGGWIGKVLSPISKIVGWVGKLVSAGTKLLGPFAKFFGILGPIIRIGAMFVKWIPIIGWIITAIQLVVSLVSRLMKGEGWGAVTGALYDTLIGPFVDAYKWIKGLFIGNSPSKIGEGIVKGLDAVVDSVFDLLTYPWRKAFEYLKKIPILGKLFSGAGNLVSKITGDITQQVEAQANTVVEIKNLDVLREAIDALTAAVAQLGSVAASSTTSSTGNDKTADKVQELIDLLRNGAIAVNLDGRRVSSALTNVGR